MQLHKWGFLLGVLCGSQVSAQGWGARLVVLTQRSDSYPFGCAQAAFGGPLSDKGYAAAFLAGNPYDGCSSLENVTGSIVLVTRGNCDFVTKARHVQRAGGVGMVVADEVDGPLVIMNPKGGPARDISIPCVFVSKRDGNLIRDMIKGQLYEADVPCIGILYAARWGTGWPAFVLPFIVIFVVCIFLLGSFLVYRHRTQSYLMLPSFGGGPLPSSAPETATREEIDTLPHQKPSADTCSICLEDFEGTEFVRVLACGHEFHTGCVDRWLATRRRTCPVCKRDAIKAHIESTPLLAPTRRSAQTSPEQSSSLPGRILAALRRPQQQAGSIQSLFIGNPPAATP